MQPFIHLISAFEKNRDVRSAKRFMRGMVRAIGPGFHPETPINDYVENRDGFHPIFTASFAERLQTTLDAATEVLHEAAIDPSEVALPVQRRLLMAR